MGRFSVVYDYHYKAIIDLISKVAHSNLFCVKVLLNFMMIHHAPRGIDVMILCLIVIDMLCSAFFS